VAAVLNGGGRRRHIMLKGAPVQVGEWIKRRGPECWHLVDLGSDLTVACGTPDVRDADAVIWTDPDRYPPDRERCPPCQSIFSGAVSQRPPESDGPMRQLP
jgi:hypothetical protein